MKLPDFQFFGPLNALRTQMAAELTESYTFKPPHIDIELPVDEKLRTQGVDVNFDEVTVLPDGTFAYKGRRVLIYIRDVSNYGDRQSLPRFHLASCQTLVSMREKNRWTRYVVANRDDGNFVVNLKDPTGGTARSEVARLNVCQNCLAALRWNGFHSDLPRAHRIKSVEDFQLPDFFAKFPKDLVTSRPKDTSDTAPINDYPANWKSISDAVKKRQKCRCQQCKIQLAAVDSKYLHVHHKNGQKNDCSDANLDALCISCHAEQPMHSHMKNSQDYATFMARYKGRL